MTSLSERLAARCRVDGEFRLAARYWTGSFRIDRGDEVASLVLENGLVRVPPVPATALPAGPGHIGLRAPPQVWARILAPIPAPFFNDIVPAQAAGLVVEGEQETFW